MKSLLLAISLVLLSSGCTPKPSPYFVDTKDFMLVPLGYSVDVNPGEGPEPRCSLLKFGSWEGTMKVSCQLIEDVSGLISDIDADRARYKKNIEVNKQARAKN